MLHPCLPMCSARCHSTWPFVLLITALLTLNCAGPEPAADAEPEAPDSPDGPAYALLVHTDTQIALHTLATNDRTMPRQR